MLLDKVVCQLMAHRDPPPAHSMNPDIPARLEVLQMQLFEPVVVEEKRTGLVEGDSGSAVIVEYVHRLRSHIEDRRDVKKEIAKCIDARSMGREKL